MPWKNTDRVAKNIANTVSEIRRQPLDWKDLRAKVSRLQRTDGKFATGAESAEKSLTHVAIIMDGNGRWAKARGLPRVAGHREGVAAARSAIEAARDIGLKHLTLYSFSTENWSRPEGEVQDLMDLLRRFIKSDLAKLVEENVCVKIIGNKDTLPGDLKKLVIKAENDTAANDGYYLHIAFNYGGRDEIVRAVRRLADRVEAGEISPEDIDENLLASQLDTDGVPDPDLVIRTSGEQRISNFLLWQTAYAEYVFLDEYWPDFSKEVFLRAVEQYRQRDRRFGGRQIA